MSNVDIISENIQELYDVRPSTAHMVAELIEMLVNIIDHECDMRMHEKEKER